MGLAAIRVKGLHKKKLYFLSSFYQYLDEYVFADMYLKGDRE
jgi:hypothetical protein